MDITMSKEVTATPKVRVCTQTYKHKCDQRRAKIQTSKRRKTGLNCGPHRGGGKLWGGEGGRFPHGTTGKAIWGSRRGLGQRPERRG